MYSIFNQLTNMAVSSINSASNTVTANITARAEARNAAIRAQNTELANVIARGIMDYHPCPVECFFDDSGTGTKGNTVISGGSQSVRNRTVISSIGSFYYSSIPVIILHQANKQLENMAMDNYKNILFINSNNPFYDPIIGSTYSAIRTIAVEASSDIVKIQPNGTYYIQGIMEYMKHMGVEPSIYAFASFSYDKVLDKIINGLIPDPPAESIKKLLQQGETERGAIHLFFEELLMQLDNITPKKLSKVQRISVTSAVTHDLSIMIDIPPSTHSLSTNLLVSDIKSALSLNKPFLLVIDDIQISDNKALKELLRQLPDSCVLHIANNDLFSSFGGDENTFDTITGKAIRRIIFKHNSANSAKKWSEAFGEYDHQEFVHSHGYSNAPGGLPGVTHGTSTSNVRKYKVSPEAITKMNDGETYFYDSMNDTIVHTFIAPYRVR